MTSLAPESRLHVRRLRDVYRSAGWPCQDTVEIELLAAGLLERQQAGAGQERVRVTDAGIAFLAAALERTKRAQGAHDQLVARVARAMQRGGRLVWTDISLRARLLGEARHEFRLDTEAPAAGDGEASAVPVAKAVARSLIDEPPPGNAAPAPRARWKLCRPDVFSIRNTSVAAYLEPIVHEIKVSRADLLGDLQAQDKRDSYLDVAGQCWYVLGCDRKGRPIGEAEEVPAECGVMLAWPDDRLEVARPAPRRPAQGLPFALWMALAKSVPLPSTDLAEGPDQAGLREST